MVNVEQVDGIVIGAGQSGGPLATALAEAGWQVAVVERAHVGGTCVNTGCTPTKAMAASARVAYLARRAADFGVGAGAVTVDMKAVSARTRGIVAEWREGSLRRLTGAEGVELIRGEARFLDPRSVEVGLNEGGARRLQARRGVFIDTGQRPRIVDLDGLEVDMVLTNRSIVDLDVLPEHLLVLGGGYLGLEFGQMFRRFGSAVTILDHGDRLAPREDAEIGRAVHDILTEDGITVELGATPRSIARAADGSLRLTVETGDGEQVFSGSHLLMAAGRVPNTDALALDAAGVETDQKGYITVSDRLETTAPGVYAMGDVKGGPAFTHISYDDFRVLRTNLIEGGDATWRGRPVPTTVFIDPQLAHVGLHEAEARRQGHHVRVGRLPMSSVARAVETGETRGLIKAVVDADTEQILGCTVLGVNGGEIMSLIEVAMLGGLPYTALRDGVFAHPLLAEAVNNLFSSLE